MDLRQRIEEAWGGSRYMVSSKAPRSASGREACRAIVHVGAKVRQQRRWLRADVWWATMGANRVGIDRRGRPKLVEPWIQ